MFNYEFYKLIHISSLLVFISFLAIALFSDKGSHKYAQAIVGVFALGMLASGLGLMKRFGIPHGGPWPFWIQVKLLSWAILSFVGVLWANRIPVIRKTIFMVFLVLALITVAFVVHKPV